jgi:peptidoglycan/xylan/chitin deacetylase (PgdA/CDA1 family)
MVGFPAGDGSAVAGSAADGSVVPVLMYHSVSGAATPAFRPYAIAPDAFRSHVALLAEHDFEAITVGEYVERRSGAGGLTDRTVVLTFDDAFTDFHTTTLPILAEHGFPATLYVPTAYVGRTSTWLVPEGEGDRPVMGWSALAEVAGAGVEIGSHSRSHPHLDTAPADRARREINDSRSELEDRLQVEVRSFAYPFGHSSPAVRRMVADAGYSSGVAVRDLASGDEDLLRMSRWTVHADTTAEQLLGLLHRRNDVVSRARSAARSLASFALRRTGLKQEVVTDPDPGIDA